MDTRVYVSNFAGHDYADAQRFGELRPITMGFISFQSLDRVKFQIAEGIRDSRPEDFLVLSGTNIVNVLAALLWMSMHGKVRILNYDKSTHKYREIVLSDESNDLLMKALRNAERNERA